VRGRGILGGLAGLVIVAGAVVAVQSRSSDNARTTVTPSAVTLAFAARGIAIEDDPHAMLEPGTTAHVKGILWNQPHASSQGVLTVLVVGSAAEAKRLSLRHPDPTASDACGGTISTDYHTWKARNVVASLARCDYTSTPERRATAPADATVAAVMGDLAG
jgi:hypothetical protein